MNMLKQATSMAELLKTERLAIKYSPTFALLISKEIYHRKG